MPPRHGGGAAASRASSPAMSSLGRLALVSVVVLACGGRREEAAPARGSGAPASAGPSTPAPEAPTAPRAPAAPDVSSCQPGAPLVDALFGDAMERCAGGADCGAWLEALATLEIPPCAKVGTQPDQRAVFRVLDALKTAQTAPERPGLEVALMKATDAVFALGRGNGAMLAVLIGEKFVRAIDERHERSAAARAWRTELVTRFPSARHRFEIERAQFSVGDLSGTPEPARLPPGSVAALQRGFQDGAASLEQIACADWDACVAELKSLAKRFLDQSHAEPSLWRRASGDVRPLTPAEVRALEADGARRFVELHLYGIEAQAKLHAQL